jgi:class 3 adenylate cyclase
MPPVRRLTAILAADVAGYSRLMGTDEEGTHERLQAHLRELVNPKINEHRGRIVKNTGDGFLTEFQSVVDAVRCAVEIQRGMAERNATIPPDKRIEFRVGVNLGDVTRLCRSRHQSRRSGFGETGDAGHRKSGDGGERARLARQIRVDAGLRKPAPID